MTIYHWSEQSRTGLSAYNYKFGTTTKCFVTFLEFFLFLLNVTLFSAEGTIAYFIQNLNRLKFFK